MYTKNFQYGNDTVPIPEKYGGTAFDGDSASYSDTTESECCGAEESCEGSKFSGLFSKKLFDFGSLPLFKNGKIKFGSEEILIIALAALLFFSKEGDRECALILLLTLFLN